MANEITKYYVDQAGSGLGGFAGVRHQRGYGVFSKLLSGTVLPALKFLERKVLKSGTNVASDMLDGKDFKKALKTRLNETSREVVRTALDRARERLDGSGRRKRKPPAKKPVAKKPVAKKRGGYKRKRQTGGGILEDYLR
jgi:hypothetical protein